MAPRIDAVRAAVAGLPPPRVFVAEWMDPPYGSGHWLPEMVEAAGGTNVLSSPGGYSFATTWEAVLGEGPELIVLAACGFSLEQALPRTRDLRLPVRTVVVDGDAHYSRPAPRLADGVRQLAHLLHPDAVARPRPAPRRAPARHRRRRLDQPAGDAARVPVVRCGRRAHIPGRCSRSEAGVIPALSRNCDAPSGMSQVACATPNEQSPRRKGGPRGEVPPYPLPPLTRRSHMFVSSRSRLRATLSPLAATRSARRVRLGRVAPLSAPATRPSFPLTVKAANGEVTIPSRPTRIVSLSPAATQDLFAEGAGTQVVAVDSYSTYPPQAPRTKLIGLLRRTSRAIAKYRPDLVVDRTSTATTSSATLNQLHIPVLLEPPATNLAGAYAQIGQLGQATGHASGRSCAVVAQDEAPRSARPCASVPQGRSKPLSVYIETGVDPYYSATSETFMGRFLDLLGLRNIANKAGGTYPGQFRRCRLSTSSRAIPT